jgi:stage III sporulation protein AH
MNIWKRNAVVAVVILFICVAVYLNWSYNKAEEIPNAGVNGE